MEKLVLHGVAPSVNHMYVNVFNHKTRKSKRVMTKIASHWFDETVLITRIWRQRNKWETIDGKVIVRLWFYFPNRRKRDTHNGLKILMDALEDAGVYKNDRYALPRIMDFDVDRNNPRIEIEFEAV